MAGTFPSWVEQWSGPHGVEWEEGNHRRGFSVDRILEDTPERFRFRDTQGEVHELRPMTLELYESRVREKTIGRRSYGTLEELLESMRREW